jgi:hypothetical protein
MNGRGEERRRGERVRIKRRGSSTRREAELTGSR